jgi:5-methylcytosine-specific restriction endonuclease McrA
MPVFREGNGLSYLLEYRMTVEIITTEHGTSYLNCTCDHSAIRIRTQSNGVQIYSLQCLDCGRQIKAVSKNAPEILEMPNRLPFDEDLKTRWRERQREHWEKQSKAQQQAREQERQQQSAEWWQQYDAYLQTPAWRAKRAAVLERDDHLCQGCRKRAATQAHHLTYEHVGNELLFELVAICEMCHRVLHPDMD